MDDKRQEWRQDVLLPLLKQSPDTKPSPELERLLERDPTHMDLALLAADTDRTQDYVFESARLPEIRGASRHLDDLNHALEGIVTQRGGHVIYASGGGLLAFVPTDIAELLAVEIEQVYPQETTVATITADWRAITPQMVVKGYPANSEVPFSALAKWAATWLRRRKENHTTAPFIEALPYMERCRSCRTRPANPSYLARYPEWPLCDVCYGKRFYLRRDAWFQRFQDHLEKNPSQADHYYGKHKRFAPLDSFPTGFRPIPQDLSEIGEACAARSGYVGFIYLDGDGIGKAFEQVPTPQSYTVLSQAVEDAAQTAVMQALATWLHPARVHPSDARPQDEKPGDLDLNALGQILIHPFDIITIGGDDVILIVPADVALPIAASICQTFQDLVRQRLAERNPPKAIQTQAFTLSGGVILASDHNPVRVLRDLAKELQREAKKVRKLAQANEGYLDFLILKSADMLDSSVRGARTLYPYTIEAPGLKPLRLLARPYCAATVGQLWEALQDLRASNLPTSQMQLLAEALLRGRQEASLFYLYQNARQHTRQDAFKQLTRALEIAHGSDNPKQPIPWQDLSLENDSRFATLKKDFSYQTALWDIAELYDFVPARKEASG